MRHLIAGMAFLALVAVMPCLAQADDEAIAKEIVSKLRQAQDSGAIKGFSVDLEVDEGAVWMKGHFSSSEHKAHALGIAQRVQGVTQVVDDLEIKQARTARKPVFSNVMNQAAKNVFKQASSRLKPVKPAAEEDTPKAAETTQAAVIPKAAVSQKPASATAVQPLTDQELAQRVIGDLRRLKDSGQIKGFHVDVDVTDASVWIRGDVASASQRSLILESARRVAGVKQVVNDIAVRPTTRRVETTPHVAQRPAPIGTAVAAKPKKVASKPLTQQPIVHPVAQDPIAQESVAAKPVATQPVATLPVTTLPVTTQPVTTQPVATQPAATQPAATQPAATQPVATQPAAKKPAAAAPATTAPAPVTEDKIVKKIPRPITEEPAKTAELPATIARPIAQEPVARARTEEMITRPEAQAIARREAKEIARLVAQEMAREPIAQVTAAEPKKAAPQVPAGFMLVPVAPSYPLGYAPQQPMSQRVPQVPLAVGSARTVSPTAAYTPVGGGMTGAPVPMHRGGGPGVHPAQYEHPQLPGYAWPSYASYPNYGAVTYPKQHSAGAWPYIGPFYPYPQVPLGWRKVQLQWDDGWWFLDFKSK